MWHSRRKSTYWRYVSNGDNWFVSYKGKYLVRILLLAIFVIISHGLPSDTLTIEILLEVPEKWTLPYQHLVTRFQIVEKIISWAIFLSEMCPPQHWDKKEIVPHGVIPIKNFSVVLFIVRVNFGTGIKTWGGFNNYLKTINDHSTIWKCLLES